MESFLALRVSIARWGKARQGKAIWRIGYSTIRSSLIFGTFLPSLLNTYSKVSISHISYLYPALLSTRPKRTPCPVWCIYASLHCTVLYCTVLYCTVLYCTALYCTVLYGAVLHCTALYCTALYCTALYCTVVYCSLLPVQSLPASQPLLL